MRQIDREKITEREKYSKHMKERADTYHYSHTVRYRETRTLYDFLPFLSVHKEDTLYLLLKCYDLWFSSHGLNKVKPMHRCPGPPSCP